MSLPDGLTAASSQVLLANSTRAQQFGRYVFRIESASSSYWLKLQRQQSSSIHTQSFIHECQLYAQAKRKGIADCMLPHERLATDEVLDWLDQQPNFARQGILTNLDASDDWITPSLLIVAAEPLWPASAITLEAWLQFTGQCIDVLGRLHQVAIHGDLKPEHFVSFDQHVYLIDFEKYVELKETTSQQQLHATPRYMAPELFHGQPYSIQSDYYALGIILLEQYLQQRLSAKTYLDWATLHCQYDLLATVELDSVRTFLQGLLAKWPQQRYQNCVELSMAYQKMSKNLK